MKKIFGLTALMMVLGISSASAWELPHIWNPPCSSCYDGGSSGLDDWHGSPMWGSGNPIDTANIGTYSEFSDPLGLWELRGGHDGVPRGWDDSGRLDLPHIWAR